MTKIKHILFYYHHFGGLGHGTRIFSLCKQLKQSNSNYNIVVLNSGKPQPELNINKYAKVINLPYFEAKENLFSGIKSKNSINITFKKRKIIMNELFSNFYPDIAIFEHFPFGRDSLQNEIVPLIIKLKRKGVLIYSSVRDIIDQQVNTNKLDKILNLFNGVFVHSDKNKGFITNFKKTEKLNEKLIFTGRLFSKTKNDIISKSKIIDYLNLNNKKLIVASIGGGIDGLEILSELINIKKKLDSKFKCLLLITTGPSINNQEFLKLKNKLKNINNIQISKFNSNYIDYVYASDVSISMAGYNSINNAIITNVNTIVIPRPSENEQYLRIRSFQDLPNLVSINFKDIKKKLYKSILNLLSRNNENSNYSFNNMDNSFSKFIENIYTLKSLKIRLTNACNCNCDMCTWIKEPISSLSLQQINEIINDADKLGVKVINLTGGEPTNYIYFKKIIRNINHRGIGISLSTNFSFKLNMLNFLIKNNLKSLDFSLDSINKSQFNTIRQKNYLFEAIERNLTEINKKKLKLNIHLNFTIRKDNYTQAPDIMDFCKKYNINSVSFHLIQKTEININFIKHILLDKNDMSDFYFEIVPIILKKSVDNIKVNIVPFISELNGLPTESKILKLILLKSSHYENWVNKIYNLYTSDKYKLKNTKKILHFNCTFDESLRINMDGEFSPCCTFDDTHKFSTIKDISLLDFWLNKPYNGYNKFPFDKCYSCLKNNNLF